MRVARYTITELKYPDGSWQGRIQIDDKESGVSGTFDSIDLRCFLANRGQRLLMFDELTANHQNIIGEFLDTVKTSGVPPLKPPFNPRLN